MSKYLIVPVEIKSRELESRLLISISAVEHGFKVIFGGQNQIKELLDFLPKGIYLDKSISKNKFNFLENLVNKGYILTSIDEEGLTSQSDKWLYLKQRVSEKTLNLVSKMFTWGEDERRLILKAYPKFSNKIVATGNPRVDLWKKSYYKIYEQEILEIQKKYGHYILFPSSFPVMHSAGNDFVKKQAIRYKIIENEEDEAKFDATYDFFKKSFEKYIELVNALAKKFPKEQFIVRPHPSERVDYWKEVTSENSNIKVVSEYSVSPWILGSKCVIHSSCTTGLESFLFEKPVLSYLPYKDNEYVEHISNKVSDIFHNEDEISYRLNLILNDSEEIPNNREKKIEIIRDVIINVDGTPSYNRIVDELIKLNVKEEKFHTLKLPYSFKVKRLLKNAKLFIHRHIVDKNKSAYKKQKMPGISKKEVLEKIRDFKHANEDFKNVEFKVKEIYNGIFIIDK